MEAPMFTVRWVARGQEVSNIGIEKYRLHNPDVIVEACRLRLEAVQKANPNAVIDGLIVLDREDNIVRRWFPLKL
jgi:hypothetical protein